MNFKTTAPFFLSVLLTLTGGFQALAQEGKGVLHGGGGGDPFAIQFVEVANLLAQAQGAGRIHLGVSNERLNAHISKVQASLEGKSPLVDFPAGWTVDCFGFSKPACVDVQGFTHVARLAWDHGSPAYKVELVAMELMKVLNVTSRYRMALMVSRTLDYRKQIGTLDALLGEGEQRLRLESLLIEKDLKFINAALFRASGQKLIPQFELVQNSAYDCLDQTAFINSVFIGPEDVATFNFGTGVRSRSDEQISSSGITRNVKRGQIAMSFVLQDTFTKCGDVGKMRLFLKSAMTSEEPLKGGKTSYVYLNSPEDLNGGVPPVFAAEKSKGAPLLSLCARDAINQSLLRTANDKMFNATVGFDFRLFEILSIYRVLGENSEKLVAQPSADDSSDSTRETYIINIIVRSPRAIDLIIPYSFRISAQRDGNSCRISDVITP